MNAKAHARRQHIPGSIEHPGLVRLGVTAGFGNLVTRFGGDPDRVIEKAGLKSVFDTPATEEGGARITLGAFSSFLRAAAVETGLPTFSVEFAHIFDVRSLGPIGYLFQLAPDLGTALRDFCTHFELVQDNTEIGVEMHGNLARIVYAVRGGDPREKAPDAEFSVAMLATALGVGLRAGVDVQRLDLEHRPDWQRDAAPHWLKRDIQPSTAGNAVLVPRDLLDQPGCFSDAYLYRMVMEQVRNEHRALSTRQSLTGAVTDALRQAFSRGRIQDTIAAHIAGRFGISTRTLHRQLTLHGSSFRALRNAAMLQDARLLLAQTDTSITEVALMMGFSETSAFSRAFKQLTGEQPIQYRNAHAHRNGGQRQFPQ